MRISLRSSIRAGVSAAAKLGRANVEFMIAARSVLPVMLGPGFLRLRKAVVETVGGETPAHMVSVPGEPSEAVIADSEICLLRWRGSSSLPHSP